MSDGTVHDVRRSTAADLRKRIEVNLASRDWVRAEPTRAAAVSVIAFDVEAVPSFCLIKRARRGRNAGQWALPGGKVEPGESPQDAALREASEEVGLPAGSRVLGRLDDMATTSGFVIAPFVVAAPDGWRPRAADAEVHACFEFAVPDLLGDDVVRWATVDDGPPLLQMHVAPGTRIHAPTGGILWQFRQTALLGQEVSLAGLRQPEFTRR